MSRWNENTADALRNTAAVLLPLLVLYPSAPEPAVGIAVGVLLISLTDLPGNRRSKGRSALQCILLFGATAFIFSAGLISPLLTGVILVTLTFLLAMLPALGPRSALAGAMATALMVFLLGLHPHKPWLTSFYILIGCCWFYLVTLIQVYIWPFRSLRQALQEAREAMGDLLEAKAACYDPATPLDEGYRNIIKLHIKVWEKQELIRELLISDRAVKKALVQDALQVMSLYEQVIAMHYDYAEVREALPVQALSLSKMLGHLLALQAKTGQLNKARFEEVSAELLALPLPKPEAAVIRGIVTNVRAIHDKLTANSTIAEPVDAKSFLPDQGNYLNKFKAQLHFGSPIFRFALRLAILIGVGYAAATFFSKDHYSYWLLLTILIVARPRLSVTWQRNGQRLAGTAIGVIIAGLSLWTIHSPAALLAISALALFGFFFWNRPKYPWSVVCVTISVLVSLSVYHGQAEVLLTARIGYSLAGCLLATAGIFLFPVWSHGELEVLVKSAVKANRYFLAKVAAGAKQEQVWLARKAAHQKLAKLSEALAYARQEPGKHDLNRFEHLQVINYRINAVIISLFLAARPFKTNAIGYLDDFLLQRSTPELPVKGQLMKGTKLLEMLAQELSQHGVF